MILTLNLVDNNKSDIFYKISKFPDGQQSISIQGYNLRYIDGVEEVFSVEDLEDKNVMIKSRLNAFSDLEMIICATRALKNLDVKSIELYIPYLIGGRSDRRFEIGGVNYIKDVIAPIINMQEYKKVYIHTPHSDVTEACINNIVKLDNNDIVEFAINNILLNNNINLGKVRLLSPDAGALKRVYANAEAINYQNEIIIAAKHRNPVTGQITHTSVPMSVHDADKHIVIIDDIGDGFGTFIEIAKVIKERQSLSSVVHPNHHGKIYLVVTHSIQESGIKRALEYFDKIYTTNSVNDWKIENVLTLNVF